MTRINMIKKVTGNFIQTRRNQNGRHPNKRRKRARILTKGEIVEDNFDVDNEINFSTMQQQMMQLKNSRKHNYFISRSKSSKLELMLSLTLLLTAKNWVNRLNLEIIPQSHPYPLGWLNHGTQIQVIRQWKFVFAIVMNFVNEFVVDVVPLYICGVIFENPYLWDKDAI